jgi:hypothetical protein
MSYYRIVTDTYSGYEVQIWRWWWPFWVMAGANTHPSLDRAEAWARKYSRGVVRDLGRLP